MSVLPDGQGGFTPCPELLTEAEAVRFLRLEGEPNPSRTLRYYREKGLLGATQVGRKRNNEGRIPDRVSRNEMSRGLGKPQRAVLDVLSTPCTSKRSWSAPRVRQGARRSDA